MINLERYGDAAALVGRLFFSSMFLAFSYGKLTAFGGTSGYMGALGLPAPALFTLLAIIIEIGGGLLMLVGYQTRLVALGLALYVLASATARHKKAQTWDCWSKESGVTCGTTRHAPVAGSNARKARSETNCG